MTAPAPNSEIRGGVCWWVFHFFLVGGLAQVDEGKHYLSRNKRVGKMVFRPRPDHASSIATCSRTDGRRTSRKRVSELQVRRSYAEVKQVTRLLARTWREIRRATKRGRLYPWTPRLFCNSSVRVARSSKPGGNLTAPRSASVTGVLPARLSCQFRAMTRS